MSVLDSFRNPPLAIKVPTPLITNPGNYGFDGVFNNIFANNLQVVADIVFSNLTTDGSFTIVEYFNTPADYSELQITSAPGGPFLISVQPLSLNRSITIQAGTNLILSASSMIQFSAPLVTSSSFSAINYTISSTGLHLFSSNGPPGSGAGNNGDFSFNIGGATGTAIYQKRAGAWVAIV